MTAVEQADEQDFVDAQARKMKLAAKSIREGVCD